MNLNWSVWRASFCHQTTPLPMVEGQRNTFLLRELAEMNPETKGQSVKPRQFWQLSRSNPPCFGAAFFPLLILKANAGIQIHFFCNCLEKKNENGEENMKQKKEFSTTEADRVICFPPSCALQVWAVPKVREISAAPCRGSSGGRSPRSIVRRSGKRGPDPSESLYGTKLHVQWWGRCGGHGQACRPPGEGILCKGLPYKQPSHQQVDAARQGARKAG